MSFRKLVVYRQKVHVFFYKSHVFCAKVVDFFRAMGVCNVQPVFWGSKSAKKRRACEDYTFLCRALDFPLARNLVKSAKARNFAVI